MSDIRRFWLDSHKWPIDTPDWIFLGNAVDRIGKGLFNEDWTGDEPRAWAYSGTDREAQQNCIQRFGEVAHTIRSEAVAGRLVTGMRPRDGGNVTPMPAEWWNTEKLRPRFKMCQIAPSDPFGLGSGFAGSGYRNRNDYGAPEYCWILIRAESLDRFIKSFESRPASSYKARQRAEKFLTPRVTKQRPDGDARARLDSECMAQTGVNVNGLREVWKRLRKSGVVHPSWSKRGAPKLHG